MLYKLAVRNMRRSIRDYTIYFLTLVFGIAIFYMFNALGSQSVLSDFMKLSDSAAAGKDTVAKGMYQGLEDALGYVSVFVAFVLGFLVVYANTFMIRRRKKEFGVYLTLGMSSIKISFILLIETLIVGAVSLIAGIIIGVLLSQLMSVFVVQMFGFETTSMTFVFSMESMLKTMLYFGIVFVFTLIINLITVSGTRLINLLNAERRAKSEEVRHPIIAVAGFAAGVGIILFAYIKTEIEYRAKGNSIEILGSVTALIPLLIIGTFLVIISLSGFILSMLSFSKKFRLTGLNVFVVKQLGSRLRSNVIIMTITTIILTITFTATSASLSFTVAERKQMNENFPVDVVVGRFYNIQSIGEEMPSIYDEMKESGFDMDLLSEYGEFTFYSGDLAYSKFFSEDDYNKLKAEKKLDIFDTSDVAQGDYNSYFSGSIIVLYESDYNEMAKVYHLENLKLEKGQYAFMCNVDGYKDIMDKKLAEGYEFEFEGVTYKPAKSSCIVSNLYPLFTATNTGTVILPDGSKIYSNTAVEGLIGEGVKFFAANFDETKNSKRDIDRMFNGGKDIDMSEGGIGFSGTTPNEYQALWDKLFDRTKIEVTDEKTAELLTDDMTAVYDSKGIIAYLKQSDGTFWTTNEDKTELVPCSGKIDMESLWKYNRHYICQYAYVDGYTEHVSESGYPMVYEDAQGKFYSNAMPVSILTPDGKIAEVAGQLEPFTDEWAPERDFIYDRKDECIYELLPDGKRNRIELSATEDFLAESEDTQRCMYFVFSKIMDVQLGIESSACALYIVLYVGMVFLMACAAVLGLKQLSDSADNKARYTTLRQIGCSEKMINNAYFKQLLFFFLFPFIIAVIHSSCILSYIVRMMGKYLMGSFLTEAIIITMIVLSLIYVSFLIVTWLGCKRMIRDGIKAEKTE